MANGFHNVPTRSTFVKEAGAIHETGKIGLIGEEINAEPPNTL